jgi:hypothetical protein
VTKKANSEIAVEFIGYLREQKLELFKETHVIGETTRHEFLHIATPGQQESGMSFQDLCQRLFQWVQATGIGKSQAQVEHIAKIVWSKTEERTAA